MNPIAELTLTNRDSAEVGPLLLALDSIESAKPAVDWGDKVNGSIIRTRSGDTHHVSAKVAGIKKLLLTAMEG